MIESHALTYLVLWIRQITEAPGSRPEPNSNPPWRVPPDEYERNMSAIGSLARERGADVIFFGAPGINAGFSKRMGILRDSLRASARSVGATYLESRPLVEMEESDLFMDECHPTAKGHAILADQLFEAVLTQPRFESAIAGASTHD